MRYAYLGVALGLITALLIAACGGSGGSSGGKSEGIPSKSNLMMEIRLGDVLNDPDLNALIDNALATFGEGATLQESLDEAAEESGIDPRDVTRMLVFGDLESDDYFGVYMEGAFQEDRLLEALESAEGPLSSEEYLGKTVHFSEERDMAFVFLGDGEILLGGRQATKDALDVMEGKASGLSGPVRDVFDGMSGSLVRMSMTLPADALVRLSTALPADAFADEELSADLPFPGFNLDVFTEIQVVGVSLDKRGDSLDMGASLAYPTQEGAQKALDAFNGLVSFTKGFNGGEDLNRLLEGLDMSLAGASVKIAFAASLEEIGSSLEGLLELSPDLFGEAEESLPVPVPALPP